MNLQLETVVISVSKKERVKTVDSLGRAYATGKYKTAVAKVYIYPGQDEIKVNEKTLQEYFKRQLYIKCLSKPFDVLNLTGMSGWAKVSGGGVTSQCRALTLGIAIALERFNPEYYEILRENKLTTYINRPKEREKPGQVGARKKKPTSRR